MTTVDRHANLRIRSVRKVVLAVIAFTKAIIYLIRKESSPLFPIGIPKQRIGQTPFHAGTTPRHVQSRTTITEMVHFPNGHASFGDMFTTCMIKQQMLSHT